MTIRSYKYTLLVPESPDVIHFREGQWRPGSDPALDAATVSAATAGTLASVGAAVGTWSIGMSAASGRFSRDHGSCGSWRVNWRDALSRWSWSRGYNCRWIPHRSNSRGQQGQYSGLAWQSFIVSNPLAHWRVPVILAGKILVLSCHQFIH